MNPSVAAGLGTCSEAQYAAETISSPPGAGCPNVSKVGELVVESPIVEGAIEGSMFFATPHQNRFGTLLALYLVAKAPERGLLIKVAGRVDADPATGRLTATFDDLPQLPYSHFNVNFREGQRSPLATPSSCGTYASELAAAPWRDPNFVLHESSPFTLSAGRRRRPLPEGPRPVPPPERRRDPELQRLRLQPLLPAPDAGPTPSRRSPPTRRPCLPGCSAKSPASPSARRPTSPRPKPRAAPTRRPNRPARPRA